MHFIKTPNFIRILHLKREFKFIHWVFTPFRVITIANIGILIYWAIFGVFRLFQSKKWSLFEAAKFGFFIFFNTFIQKFDGRRGLLLLFLTLLLKNWTFWLLQVFELIFSKKQFFEFRFNFEVFGVLKLSLSWNNVLTLFSHAHFCGVHFVVILVFFWELGFR